MERVICKTCRVEPLHRSHNSDIRNSNWVFCREVGWFRHQFNSILSILESHDSPFVERFKCITESTDRTNNI